MAIRQTQSALVIAAQHCLLLCLAGCSGNSNSLEKIESSQTTTAVSKPTIQPNSDDAASKGLIEEATSSALIQRGNSSDGDQSIASIHRDSGQEQASSSNSTVPAGIVNSHRKRGNTNATPDAETTLRVIDSLLEKARQSTDRADYGTAFRFTSEAWGVTSAHPNDSRIQKRAKEISIELEIIGPLANSKYSARATNARTTLIEK